jgi:Fe-S protein assembly co-chaperone HscB
VNALLCHRCAQTLVNPQRCRACGAFQPLDAKRDHFATLALPRSFNVDESALERRVVEFSRDLHPDLAGDPSLRARAVLGAAQVNEAFGVLREPFKRAEYLLALEGGRSSTQDKSVPEGFLEQMLEERDELEQALASGGDAVKRLEERFEKRLFDSVLELARRFNLLAVLGSPASRAERESELAALRRTLNVMAYYRSLRRELREALREEPRP